MTMEILPSADDVIAVRIEGRVDHEDMMRLIDQMSESIANHEKTHVFAEVVDFSGWDARYIPEYLRHAWPLLGKLKRFGRVAVVSNQAWLRAAARIESALLPFISYEIFDLSERERALAWVEGRKSRPRGVGIRIMETSRADALAFEIDGKLSEDDLERIAERFLASGVHGAPTRVLGKVTRLGGMEVKGLVDDDFVKMKLTGLSSVERYALVGGPAWLARWVTLVNSLAKADIRHFPDEDEAAAWAWIGAELRHPDPIPGED